MQSSPPAQKAQLQMVKFRAKSFIIVEGKQDSNNFYIVRQGQVQITNATERMIEDQPVSALGPGDFFGVVSCMSRHPRIEAATAITDCVLISVNVDQFGVLIQNHAPIAMKIILSFSQKLRKFDSLITKLTLKKEAAEDPSHLYEIGEYYYRQKRTQHAIYVYTQYLRYVPNGQHVADSRAKLKSLGIKDDQIGKLPRPESAEMVKKFPNDTILFSENEPGDELYIINSGKVKITKIVNNNEVLIAILNPGDIFGEMALLENKPRSATAIAYGDIAVMAINKANFQAMVASQPQLGTKLITLLSERTWIAFKQLNNNMIQEPIGRVYDTLLTQVQKARVRIKSKETYEFPFGPKELISMLGFNQAEGNIHLKTLMENRAFSLTADKKLYCSDLEEIIKNVEFYMKMQQRKQEIAQNRLRMG
jgi:CRP-like cAMP-binding protein